MDLGDLFGHIQTTLALAASALAVGLVAGIPLGLTSARVGRARGPILAAVNLGRVVPSLAVLTFALPLLGVGFRPALVALALLAIPPIAINTDLGIRAVAPAALDAARGMGMTPRQILLRVEWPLALPVILGGIRTAATEVVASATLASFVGAGGLGEYIVDGLQSNVPEKLLVGALCVTAIALIAESAFGLAARFATKETR